MATNTKPFSNVFSNTYQGDIITELIKRYNEHDHSIAFLKSFLVYGLVKDQVVSFFTTAASGDPDPFSGIGATVDLTITRVTATSLTLSRPANTATVGTLSYTEGGVLKTIPGLSCTNGSAVLTWANADNDAGTINPVTILKILQKPWNSYYPINNASTVPTYTPPTTAPVVNYTVGLNNAGQFIYSQGSVLSTPNQTINLVRGSVYNFNFTTDLLAQGGFHIVSDLVNTAYPLKLYTAGVSAIRDGSGTTVIGTQFYVPLTAPPTLYYQSGTSNTRYGQFNISGGELTTDNAIYALWQSATTTAIPTELPDHLIPLAIKTPNQLRLVEWNLLPQWSSAQRIGYIYVQLQLHLPNQGGISALSPVTLIDDAGQQTVPLNQDIIIPANSMVAAALYNPYLIKGLHQELYTSELS